MGHILDEDVKTETLRSGRQNNNHSQLARFQRGENDIRYLPFTPEIGLMNFIINNQQNFERNLRARCSHNLIHIQDIVRGFDPSLQGADLRESAKNIVTQLISNIEQRTQGSSDTVREQLCGVFANLAWAQYPANFMQLFGPMV